MTRTSGSCRTPHQDAAGAAQCFRHRLDGLLYIRVVLDDGLIGSTDIFQHLRIDGQRLLFHLHFLYYFYFKYLCF